MDSWLVKSVISLFSYSAMSFFIVLGSKRGVPISLILLGLGAVFVIYYSIQMFIIEKYTPVFNWTTIGLISLIGILSSIANFLAYQSATTSPNPGLSLAITGVQGAGVTLLSFIFLKDKINNMQLIGVVLSMMAITFISLGSTKQSNRPEKINTSSNNTSRIQDL